MPENYGGNFMENVEKKCINCGCAKQDNLVKRDKEKLRTLWKCVKCEHEWEIEHKCQICDHLHGPGEKHCTNDHWFSIYHDCKYEKNSA